MQETACYTTLLYNNNLCSNKLKAREEALEVQLQEVQTHTRTVVKQIITKQKRAQDPNHNYRQIRTEAC